MRNTDFRLSLLAIFAGVFALISSCSYDNSDLQNDNGIDSTSTVCLEEVMRAKTLVAVTNYSSTNYFVYKGKPMGYHYEMLRAFADHLGVQLEIKVTNDLKTAFIMLLKGKCDLIAQGITFTRERSNVFGFSEPILQSRQVLVQRVPNAGDTTYHRIKNVLDLANKTIHIPRESCFMERLESLSNEIGQPIHIIEVPDAGTEQLISQVASGEIDYTVCDGIVGLVNKTYYPNIDVKLEISFVQNIGWVTRRECPGLRKELDNWLNGYLPSPEAKQLYAKYFRNPKSAKIVKSDYYSVANGRISIYDEVLKKQAKEIDWDWRLLASLIFEESRFMEDTVSWAGAYGIMQLMPGTAERFGVNRNSTSVENIAAGVKFIKWLDRQLPAEVKDKNERIKFILASYNIGPGHIFDARRIAEKYDLDPNTWSDNVEVCLLKKATPKYYNDPVVKNGYCRGDQTVRFVKEILRRFEDYQNLVKE
ncbi:MAG: transporter substrate-binding domain-containing protein [Bacteroidetes bacterium]|nr:transporter substrate-binding domain-containing protein [Bacteroidota bacterium]MBU1717539.1 transporter substrate-binding domain-containing protein [Bacteroidota bacterium]